PACHDRRRSRVGVLSPGLLAGRLRPRGRAAVALPGQLRGGPHAHRPPRRGTLDPGSPRARPAGRPAVAGVPCRRLRGGTELSQVPDSPGLYERACAIIPGGVNSPVRAFGAGGGGPGFIASGSGPHLTDTGGRPYGGPGCPWGPEIPRPRPPPGGAAGTPAGGPGSLCGAATLAEVELAEEIAARAPVDKVRLVNSGTEATMSAVRLARAFTGRSLVVKFAGCYHGHVDALLAAAGSGVATLALPDSPGV